MIIPFFIPHAGCPHQCVFCDQKSNHREKRAARSVVHTFYHRILSCRGVLCSSCRSCLLRRHVHCNADRGAKSIPRAVQPFIAAGRISGIRLSTRPDAMTPDILVMLKQHHVTTIELGAQSMDDEVLRLSGRGHTQPIPRMPSVSSGSMRSASASSSCRGFRETPPNVFKRPSARSSASGPRSSVSIPRWSSGTRPRPAVSGRHVYAPFARGCG